MLIVYIASDSKEFDNMEFTYRFPENGLSPWEQLDWMQEHLNEFLEKDITICTFSPYILNFLNLMLAKKELSFDNLEVYELYTFEDDNGIIGTDKESKKIFDKGMPLIDTRSYSHTISYIYDEYNKIRNKP